MNTQTVKIIISPEMRRFNRAVAAFDKQFPFSPAFDRCQPWQIVAECERQGVKALGTRRAAGWWWLALEIAVAERAVNPRSLADVKPVTAEMAD